MSIFHNILWIRSLGGRADVSVCFLSLISTSETPYKNSRLTPSSFTSCHICSHVTINTNCVSSLSVARTSVTQWLQLWAAGLPTHHTPDWKLTVSMTTEPNLSGHAASHASLWGQNQHAAMTDRKLAECVISQSKGAAGQAEHAAPNQSEKDFC